MEGHGALSLYLKNNIIFKSASAFAPVWFALQTPYIRTKADSNSLSNPSKSPWGVKAFSNYLSPSTSPDPPAEWLENDASHILATTHAHTGHQHTLHILVDVGTADPFLAKGQLEPKAFEKAAEVAGKAREEVEVRMQEGFDHSYYFVSDAFGAGGKVYG